MASFQKKTVWFIQDLFHTNVLKYVLGCIKSFDVKIDYINTNVNAIPSNPIWNFQKVFHFKH